jgi:hypothetical protein
LASQQPTLFDLPKVLAVGIVSPAAAAITSRFGIAGTVVGLVLSSVLITAGVDLLKVYLARVPGAVTSIPGGFRKKSSLRNIIEKMKRPFSKFASLPSARRRSLVKGSLVAAGISCIVGLILITVLEVGVGKSLSCWVWDDCSVAESSSADGSTSSAQASTLPTILGGTQSSASSSSVSQGGGGGGGGGVNPPNPQQQRGSSAGTPQGAPSQAAPPSVSGAAQTPEASPGAQPAQRQGPSGPIEEDAQQQAPSSRSAPSDQQSPSTPDQQSSSTDDSAGSEGWQGSGAVSPASQRGNL